MASIYLYLALTTDNAMNTTTAGNIHAACVVGTLPRFTKLSALHTQWISAAKHAVNRECLRDIQQAL
jgi:hypothetical protein